MGATRWVPVGAAALLVLGVLLARGGTATDEGVLAAPVPSAGPSVAPSRGTPDGPDATGLGDGRVRGPLVLAADGLPGLRLGSPDHMLTSSLGDLQGLPDVDGDGETTPADLPGGCEPTYSGEPEDGGWSTSGWVVDGLVSSVQLTRWDPGPSVLPGVRTWLGPTLGSPLEAAAELPGARTSAERPHGDAGPVVTVVRVPVDGAELVVSDAATRMDAVPEGSRGRITTIELRHPRARACSQEALQALGPAVWGRPEASGLDLTLGVDGVAAFPIGTPVQALQDEPGVDEQLTLGACTIFSAYSEQGGLVRLAALDGVVVRAQTYGPVPSTLGVAHGGTEADVRTALPGTWDRYPGDLPEAVEVVVGDRVVAVSLRPGERYVPDVDVPVQGGPSLVEDLAVRAADVQPSRLC